VEADRARGRDADGQHRDRAARRLRAVAAARHRRELHPLLGATVGRRQDRRPKPPVPRGQQCAQGGRADQGQPGGIVTNGLQLRLLRDSHTFTRRPYLEFDLEAIFNGELFSDFRLLWLCAHASRLLPAEATPKRPESAPIERWFARAKEEGARVRDRLRDGVEKAITGIGSGLLRHPANAALNGALRSGALSPQGYYRQLLRLVYRLIFVFVAEDRGVLLPPIDDALDPELAADRRRAQDRYTRYYATAKLRELALRRRGSPHGDRWRGLSLVLSKLHRGCAELDLPALGSALFDPETTPELSAVELANRDLLPALRALCTFKDDAGFVRAVSWRSIGADELGSVFESLLELHPLLHRESGSFALKSAAGNERKTTGSYYTPESLVECLLDSALDPVLDRACTVRGGAVARERALLRLKVCDPSCGSGHFLVAAGRRIAHRLAQIRADDNEPSPIAVRHALRDVYARCLFGVDINPMAVELCKVSLWIEAIDPERPLPFLDGHILQGNALLGATPALIAGGVPDKAWKPIEGDDRTVASRLRTRNRDERKGKAQGVQHGLFSEDAGVSAPTVDYGRFASRVEAIEAMDDGTLAGAEAKARRYREHLESPETRALRRIADTWCAAFVWPKDAVERHEEAAPTHWLFERIAAAPTLAPPETATIVDRLAAEYEFFHWYLAFPQVFSVVVSTGEDSKSSEHGWDGGFDVVLGNPPWERIKLQEKEFFATRSPTIAGAKNAAARKKMIAKLPMTDPSLWDEWRGALRVSSGESQIVRLGDRYPLCGRGDINTYSIFAELDREILDPSGRLGIIVPAGIAMDDTTKLYFADLVNSRTLVSLFHFENEDHIFAGIHNALRFCLLTIGGAETSIDSPMFSAFSRQAEHLRDPDRRYTLSAEDFARINPNTRTLPTFRRRIDAAINAAIYRKLPVLWDEHSESGNPWGVSFKRMLDMANDSGLFRTREQLDAEGWGFSGNCYAKKNELMLPLYEAKMVHHFDHRFGTYDGQTQAQANKGFLPYLTPEDHAKPLLLPESRYWVDVQHVEAKLDERWSPPWFLGWRDVCRNSDIRTVIPAVLPRDAVGHKFPLMCPSQKPAGALLANLTSFALDYAARQKVGGTSLTLFILKQFPVLPPSAYDPQPPWDPTTKTLADWILPRVLELTYTAWDLAGFARDHGYDGPPFRWDEERRFWLRAELDAAYFHLYGLAEAEVDHVMESFWLVRQRDQKTHDSYRTKEAILDLYRRMAAAMAGGEPYATVLDPPPADPSVAHPWLTRDEAEQIAPVLQRALGPDADIIAETTGVKHGASPPRVRPVRPIAPVADDTDAAELGAAGGPTPSAAATAASKPRSSAKRAKKAKSKPTPPTTTDTRAARETSSRRRTAASDEELPLFRAQPDAGSATPTDNAPPKPRPAAPSHAPATAEPTEDAASEPPPTRRTAARAGPGAKSPTPASLHSREPLPGDPPAIHHLLAAEDLAFTPPMLATLRALHAADDPLGKSALLAAAAINPKDWTKTIGALLDAGLVDKQGQRRGAKYRIAD